MEQSGATVFTKGEFSVVQWVAVRQDGSTEVRGYRLRGPGAPQILLPTAVIASAMVQELSKRRPGSRF
ncbi:hypothetical protein thsps21_40910 [Pseudomonas sp. No.21]|jgi:hypothetical protein|uniref:hypothetical protein n=1 Tax=Pseudomonas TaxID=286 RepID=UPI000DAA3C6B|nr:MULTISPECIES: hypothetical protein [Pseudomonas]MDW3711115.1 hypothetical protein [Pseudomonas sp. 2023EL-01195]PZE14295.1 hypothetical protein DMX10_05985 [Pseudomonas sp. 57B-090624]GJN49572.1 hypothetical protein TUM20249_55580 [Pseudomonas tohonis]